MVYISAIAQLRFVHFLVIPANLNGSLKQIYTGLDVSYFLIALDQYFIYDLCSW